MAIKQYAVGVTFVWTVQEDGVAFGDISGATTKDVYFCKPDGVTIVGPIATSFFTDGSDSKVTWTNTARADFNVAGTWTVEGHIIIDGYDGPTFEDSFEVIQTKFTVPPLP